MARLGKNVLYPQIVPDDREATDSMLQEAAREADFVITTWANALAEIPPHRAIQAGGYGHGLSIQRTVDVSAGASRTTGRRRQFLSPGFPVGPPDLDPRQEPARCPR